MDRAFFTESLTFFLCCFLCIIIPLWVTRIRRLTVAANGQEYDARIVSFHNRGFVLSRPSGYAYSYIVQINADGKTVLAETVDTQFVLPNSKPDMDGIEREVTVIYDLQKEKCIIGTLFREKTVTVILAAVSLLLESAIIYDILMLNV